MSTGASMRLCVGLLNLAILFIFSGEMAAALSVEDVLIKAAQQIATDVGANLDANKGSQGICISPDDDSNSESTIHCRDVAPATGLVKLTSAIFTEDFKAGDPTVEEWVIDERTLAVRDGGERETHVVDLPPTVHKTYAHFEEPVYHTSPVTVSIDLDQDSLKVAKRTGMMELDAASSEPQEIGAAATDDMAEPVQKTVEVDPGECKLIRTVVTDTETKLTAHFDISIYGDVLVWLDKAVSLSQGQPQGDIEIDEEAVYFPDQQLPSTHWKVPAGALLGIAQANGLVSGITLQDGDGSPYFTDILHVTDLVEEYRVDTASC